MVTAITQPSDAPTGTNGNVAAIGAAPVGATCGEAAFPGLTR
jgi:hypothetical protein